MSNSRCPSCHQLWPKEAFECPHCELLLVDEVSPSPPAEGSVVQALLERPQAVRQRGRLTPPSLSALGDPHQPLSRTRSMWDDQAPRLEHIPEVIAELRMTDLDLSPFEAWVATRIDGVSPAIKLVPVLALSAVEVRVVLKNLVDKRVITLRPPNPAAKRAPPAPAADQPSLAPAPGPAEASPPTNPHLIQRLLDLERQGRFDEVARLLDFGIAQSPDAARLYNRLALILIGERRDWVAAEALLQKAVRLAPQDQVFRKNLTMVHDRVQRMPKAAPAPG